MIRHDLHIDDVVPVQPLLFDDQLLEPGVYLIPKDRSPVLGAEDDMVLTTVDDAVCGVVPFVRVR